ncbi:helix-turn-helix transcriptional regulator [Bradyrhizobium sp. USDA 4448]
MFPKLLTFNELRAHGVLLGRRQIDRLEAEGRFPRRVPMGERRVGWVTAEVVAHVEAAISRRSTRLGTLGSHTEG